MSNDQLMVPQSGGELEVAARSSAAVAEVKAAYALALQRPRDIFTARRKMLDACKRKRFSEIARYRRPVGRDRNGNQVFAEGFSVHFARPAAVMLGNILINTGVLYEDEKVRKVVARATDLESNVAYTKEAVVEKTIEKASNKGREVISERTNSYGKTTYLCIAFPHEVDLKAAKVTAILLRDCVLPLIPPDLLDEVEDAIVENLSKEMEEDPAQARKNLVDAFAKLGVNEHQLKQYLKHDIDGITAHEYTQLRAVWKSLDDGQAVWADYVEPPAETASLKTTDGREKYDDKKPTGESTGSFGFPKGEEPPPPEEPPAEPEAKEPPKPKTEKKPANKSKEPQAVAEVRQLFQDRTADWSTAKRNEAQGELWAYAGIHSWNGIDGEDKYDACMKWIAEHAPEKE